jgi:hypothetical protein
VEVDREIRRKLYLPLPLRARRGDDGRDDVKYPKDAAPGGRRSVSNSITSENRDRRVDRLLRLAVILSPGGRGNVRCRCRCTKGLARARCKYPPTNRARIVQCPASSRRSILIWHRMCARSGPPRRIGSDCP